MNVSPLLRSTQTALSICRNFNCWTAAISKKHRQIYARTYPTYLILPDGSSINIEYDVPRRIITLPLDINILSEKDRQVRLTARKPVVRVTITEEEEDSFDAFEFLDIKK
ncbi:mitochondrial ribosomal protein L55 [Ptiloglossa arizonensis]|uniref:mitochondrial ribosomal protein L55 n=1 Tax=Ptiloglossa arizonensis TaxID=3350558 RepID=UPI003FA0AF6F